MRPDYNKMLEHCQTDRQREIIQACIDHPNQDEAGVALGINARSIRKVITRIRANMAQSGELSTVGAPGYMIKGESLLLDGEGNVKQKWVKTQADKEAQLEAFIGSIKDVFDDYTGKSILVDREEAKVDEDLLCIIPWGDLHCGLRVWEKECGQNFDLNIAKRDIQCATERLIDSAPVADTMILLDLGDSLHFDSNRYATTSGTVLDCDSRYSYMFETCILIMVHSINEALRKFNNVIVRNVVGNHSEHGEQALRYALWAYYHNNDRVKIEMSPSKFWYYQFGKVLLGSTHGDKVKHDRLPLLMAQDVPKMWGDTIHRYMYIGHIHHQTVKEHPGCVIESFNTVAPNDAWHTASGYRSRQNMRLIVHHKKYGEVERITKDISMIHDQLTGD